MINFFATCPGISSLYGVAMDRAFGTDADGGSQLNQLRCLRVDRTFLLYCFSQLVDSGCQFRVLFS